MPALHSGSAATAAAAGLGAVVYSGVVGLALWSYLATFLAEPGHVPRGWHPFQDGEASVGLEGRGGLGNERCCREGAIDGLRLGRWQLLLSPFCCAAAAGPNRQSTLAPALAQAAAAELAAWEQLAVDQQAGAAQRRAHAYSREWEGEAARAAVNRPRYCRKCQAWKPPRAHHDSMTGRCVLRMDHYCM